jgi:serine/threonine protein kinase
MNDSLKNKFAVYENPSRYVPKLNDWIENYQIKGDLGEGTFGLVYKVVDKTGQSFALKMIKLWEIAFEKERKNIIDRFVREFEIGNVDSKYLVKSVDCGRIQGNPYIIMEICEGGNLSNLVNKAYDLQKVNKIAYQILCGLQEIHNRGYFHRDIKPGNVLLDENGNAKVADFGIAGHKNSRMTVKNIFGHVNQIFGTWAYLAPEQANNKTAFKALDAVADIFSFGVMMFEVLTGEFPFPPYKITNESELADYVSNVKKGNYDGLQKNWNKLPGNWASIIKQCIEPEYQNKRFQTVGQIINMLGYKSIEIQYAQYDSIKNELILQVTYGEETGKIYNLSKMIGERKEGILTLGRKDPSVKNDIEVVEVNSTFISRKHATIEKWANPKQWIIRDGQFSNGKWQNSVNQLYVNSRLANENGLIINTGDIITMGDTILKVSVR